MFLWIILTLVVSDKVFEGHTPRFTGQELEHDSSLEPIRLAFHIVDGAFNEANREALKEEIIPAVSDFFKSALTLQPVSDLLKPSVETCNSVQVPEDHINVGLPADTIIYLHSDVSSELELSGKSCEQEGGKFKRPIVGSIGIHPGSFFSIDSNLQLQYVIREVAHVLAFDQDLFKDFVLSDGTPYSESQYSFEINYPMRGKTVKTIAFPKMLSKARSAFDCEINGLELEDFYIEENEKSSGTFWDSRIMTHDILSSHISPQTVFSDISLAVFEDSGWYYPDYAYSQQIFWGWKAGCKWIEEKCIVNGKVNLPGFCNDNLDYDRCDIFSLGYGMCFIVESPSIPPHEQYFSKSNLGGLGVADYCPSIHKPSNNFCRSSSFNNEAIGENKGSNSRCFTTTLQLKSSSGNQNPNLGAGCYSVENCAENLVTVKVGEIVMDCPFGSKISVPGFVGQLICPLNKSFCLNLPCPNLCGGRGRCVDNACKCEDGWTGSECSEACPKNCKSCKKYDACDECSTGYFYKDSTCVKCDSNCFTCQGSRNTCTSCFNGAVLVDGKCNKTCRPYCSNCDIPCSKCNLGYYLTDGYCTQCDKVCKSCSDSSSSCTDCNEGFKLQGSTCVPACIQGCTTCDYPCPSCKSGYLLSNSICIVCDNICKTCSTTTVTCTSCYDGFTLNGSTCVQGCKPNCLSCDDPCTTCEDGFYSLAGGCEACSIKCLTCHVEAIMCTSCKVGYELKGASCESNCVENCKTCSFPCEQCNDGYFDEYGLCSKCTSPCKTCAFMSQLCLSCELGYGLINSQCVEGCSDHCLKCDSPCSLCEPGTYLKNGACITCDVSCKTCDSSGNDKCHECAEGYAMSQGVCEKICQAYCESCDEPCSKCKSGYFPFEVGCQACQSTCKTCSSFDKCESCVKGYGLVSNSCKYNCNSHCLSCDSPCSLCESGYVPSNDICTKCDDSCLTCKGSPTFCTSCKSGYIYSANQCKLGCIENCKTCNHPCEACKDGFTIVDGLCQPCPQGCETCSSDMSKCYSCKQGFRYENSKCIKNCLENCKSCDSPCTECEAGYLSISGICEQCAFPCTSCINNLNFCTSCSKEYQLEDYQCLPKCLDHCSDCNDPCTSCDEGFYLYKGLCEPCHPTCRSCDKSPAICTTCQPWKKLVNGSCIESCTENCVDCSYPCRACKDGYELFQGSCTICKNYMSESDVSIEFIHDYTGLLFDFARPVSDRFSKCVYYFKEDTLDMIGSNALCTWNKQDQLVVIFGKNPDYNIRTVSMNPLSSYGSNCTSKAKDLSVKIPMNSLPRPTVSISCPSKFSLDCGNEVLVIQGITEENDYKFEFSTHPWEPKLEKYLRHLKGKVLVVPETQLYATMLNITFKATNVLGISDHVTELVEITNKKMLSVVIDAGNRIKLAADQTFSVQGIVKQNSCLSHKTLNFAWKYIELMHEESGNAIELAKKSKQTLNIKPGSLPSGRSYLFRFEVWTNETKSSSNIRIDLYKSSVVALLDRSDSSYPISEALELSAENSYDPEDPQAELAYSWDCASYTTECLDWRNTTLLTETNHPVLKIEPYRMKNETEYLFSVKVTSKARVSESFVSITAQETPGYIKVPPRPSTVNTERDLFVYPEFSLSSSNCKFDWKQEKGPAFKVPSQPNNPYLFIAKDTMLQGREYSFKLNADCENKTVFAYSNFFTNSGPNCEEVQTLVTNKTVTIWVNCSDGDFNDFPLYYVYGVIKDQRSIPLKVVHSPSITLNLNPGNWDVYVEICDSKHTCAKRLKAVEMIQESSESGIHLYNDQKIYPGSVPLAIINSASTFNTENFKEAFDDLQKYFNKLDLELVHLKMAIECLEILTYSNKTHFMFMFQKEIVEFLSRIARKVSRIDDETMKYAVELFYNHNIREHKLVSQMLCDFSEKWVNDMPPGAFREIGNNVKLIRHRFIGEDATKVYSFGGAKVTEMKLEGDPSKIYDLIIISYPGKPSSIVDIKYYSVGKYKNYSIQILDSNNQVSLDLNSPFLIEFQLAKPGDYKCQQLRSGWWIDEGCTIVKKSDKSITIETWHVSSYRLTKVHNTEKGYYALVTEGVMLILCLSSVILFCIVDKQKSNYIKAVLEPDTPESPRSAEKNTNEIDLTKRASIQVDIPNPGLYRVATYPKIVYHPWFNMVYMQNGERRAFSALHLFAVLFIEFTASGLLFNPNLHRNFDEYDKFNGFSKSQVIYFAVLLVLSQLLSGFLTYLNKIDDLTITRKYSGMGLSTVLITLNAGVTFLFALTYPAKYSFAWAVVFWIVMVVDICILSTIQCIINFKLSQRNLDITNVTRNMRVFTTES